LACQPVKRSRALHLPADILSTTQFASNFD
jgi:hypothetical protein